MGDLVVWTSMRGLLRRNRKRRLAAEVFVLLVAALWGYVFFAPLPPLTSQLPAAGTVVLAADGTVLQRDTSAGIRIPVRLDQVAPAVVQATISAEDQRFGDHPGVDPLAVARAALTLGNSPSGASTIQQQLARRLYLDGGGGPLPLRKLREMVLALQIDAHYGDSEILETYLNAVYYGRGAYGIEAAARVYFGTSASNLDLAQAAFLAGLPQLPSGYDPGAYPEAARQRQAYVLGRMRDDGAITEAEGKAASAERLTFLPELAPALAPHFVRFALDELDAVRPDLAGRGGLVIETTLDAGLQQEAERLAAAHLEELKDKSAGNAAVVAIEPGSGRLLAMVGNAGPDETSRAINLALPPRQPGSALKPFLYAAALEHGYSPATPLLDVPTTFETPQGPYTPGNYDRRFHGVVTLRTALASSYNVPAVRTLDSLGMDTFLEMLQRVGLGTLNEAERYGLSLTLGGGEVRLLDLTAAYAVLADGGLRNQPFAVQRVRDSGGTVLYERPAASPMRALAPETAWLLTDILRDPDARIPGFGRVSPLETAVGAAVKTGTTTGFHDNWAVGYTPSVVVGVWVGNADNRSMDGVSGVAGAGPAWRDIVEAAVASRPAAWPAPPGSLVRVAVCSPTGLLPGADCPSPVEEWFVRGTEPRAIEHYYTRAPDGELRVSPPAEARAWAADAGLELALDGTAPVDARVQVVAPAPGAVLYHAPELRSQEVLLRATSSGGAKAIEMRVDGQVAGTLPGADASLEWPLAAGAHVLEATALMPDGSRVSATSTFEVRER